MSIDTTSKDDMTLIADYPHYSVTRDGRVYSWTSSKFLKQSNRGGYRVVTLSHYGVAKTHTVHRLVAKAFLDNPDNKKTVNHIDGVKHNNDVSNLEWATYAENERHSFDVLGKVAHLKGMAIWIDIICPNCGDTFTEREYRGRKYCSVECANKVISKTRIRSGRQKLTALKAKGGE